MANKFQIKRTSTSGLLPNTTNSGNTSYIAAGELALNLTDKKMVSSNGSATFEIGANLTNLSVSGNVVASNLEITDTATINTNSITVGNSTVNTIITGGSLDIGGDINANGSVGTAGQVLSSGGAGANAYWRSLGTAAFQNTGTSGTTIPFLDGTNTWSAPQTITYTAGTADGSTFTINQNAAAGTLVNRSSSATNISIAYKGTTGTVYAGQGAANTWAVGDTNNLAGSNWFSVSDAEAVLSSPRLWIKETSSGNTTVSQTHGGLLFSAAGMNTTNKYTPGVLFGSTDSDLTTTNPKIGAGIVGYATEIYASDIDGAMGLEIFTTPGDPGVNGGLATLATLTPPTITMFSNTFIFKVNTGVAGIPYVSGDIFRIEGNATAGIAISTPNNATGFVTFADTEDRNSGQIFYQHLNDTMYFRAGDVNSLLANSTAVVANGDMTITGNVTYKSITQGAVPVGTAEDQRLLWNASTGRWEATSLIPAVPGNNFSVTDNSIVTGVYRYDEPSGDSGGPLTERGAIYHTRRASGGGETQIYVSEQTGRVYSRGRVTGSWSGWSEAAKVDRTNTWSSTQSFSANANFDSGVLFVDATNNRVGVGTTSPSARLDVRTAAGTTANAILYTGNSSSAATFSFGQTGAVQWDTGITATGGHYQIAVNGGGIGYQINRSGLAIDYHSWLTNGSERVRITSAGYVGIGTASPGTVLHTVNTSAGAATVGAFLQNSSGTANTEVRLAFASNENTLAQDRYGWIGYINTGGTNSGALTFATTPGGEAATERMRIDSSGNVGIGNNSPTEKLHVTGNILTSGIVRRSVATGLTAAGSTQGTALTLTSEINVVSTVASGTGVLLGNAVGGTFIVINAGANALSVYPVSGAQINSLGTNNAYSLSAGQKLEFVQTSATQYYTLNAT